jgi:hypothetical protein
MEWIEEWPTEPGNYWFYGWTWCDKNYENVTGTQPKCELIEVFPTSSGVIRILRGQFMYKSERHIGLWAKAETPVPYAHELQALIDKLQK